MARMNRYLVAPVLGLALVLGVSLPTRAHAEVPAHTRVSVNYANPKQFTENRFYGWQDRYNNVDYLGPLKAYLVKRATPMLKAGQRLEVTITDIQLAGGYEPWLGSQWSHVRIMSDRYPPRIDLTFRLTGKDGQVIREGKRTLRNLGYLTSGATMPGNTDPLRYDKALLDSWLRRGMHHL